MRFGRYILLPVLAALAPVSASADSLDPPQRVVCLNEPEALLHKFNTLLAAASERDFSRFSDVNGENRFFRPKFATLDGGSQSVEQIFALWSDFANVTPQMVTLDLWRGVSDEAGDQRMAVRTFLARIERSEWSFERTASRRVQEDYFVVTYKCDLFLIQETVFPD